MIHLKYNKKAIQFWLLNLALLLSVFAFSGFNEKILSTFDESAETELVETRSANTDFSLKDFLKNDSKTASTGFLFGKSSNRFWGTLLNFNQTNRIKYKSLGKKHLSFKHNFIRFLIKIPRSSAQDDFPFSLLY